MVEVIYSTEENVHHLGYGGENLLEDGVRLCFLRPVGLDLQAHGAWSCNKPAIKTIRCVVFIQGYCLGHPVCVHADTGNYSSITAVTSIIDMY